MNTKAEVLDDEVLDLELEDSAQADPEIEDQDEADEPEGPIAVGFEDDEPAPGSDERETPLVRDLRLKLRETQKELAQNKRQSPPQPVEVGPEPTFEDCEYDAEKFKAALLAWNERSAAVKREAEARETAWKQELADVDAQKAKLGIPASEYAAYSEEVKASLSELQQAVLVKTFRKTGKAAAMIAALGKSPAKLAAVASIEDPVELIAELVRLEGKLTMTPAKRAPEPEGTVRGSAPLSKAKDQHLERLEKEADRTGDRTAIRKYRAQLASKAK